VRIETCLLDLLKLVNEFVDIKRNTVADNAGGVVVAHAARHKMQCKSAVLVNDCVTCVRAALKANNNIALFGEHIGDFTFAFVAPIGAYYCSYHFGFSLVEYKFVIV
jgi:hypothetical protein